MSHERTIAVTDASFQQAVLNAAGPVLVKFEADWCGPCKAMRPVIDEIAAQYAGRLTVATLDVDRNNRTPAQLGVRSLPTVMLFKDGRSIAQKVGLTGKADLSALIDARLN